MFERSFRDATIRNKFRILVLAVSVLAVLGACAAFAGYLWVSTRKRLLLRQEVIATILADQSTAAMEFDQPPQAAAILGTLRAEKQIVAAAIYTRQGRLFASYLRESGSRSVLPERPAADGQRFEQGDLLDFHPILSGGERVGTIHVRFDLSDLWDRILFMSETSLIVLIVAAGVIFVASNKLAGKMTGPIERLSEVAGTIASKKDYAVRMEAGGQDEMGRLIAAFNEMLSQIQSQDAALSAARDDLEKRVAERTRELQVEVAERMEAEGRLREKDARLTEAQEIARLGSWEWIVASGKILWSDEVYLISGILPAKFGGTLTDFLSLPHPEDRALLRVAMETSCRKREPLSADFRIYQPDGSLRHLHAKGKVILDDAGRPLRVVATLQDITERKLSEQAIQDLNRQLQVRMTELAEANKELEGFSYSVSHDLRAPLRAIDGYSRMLMEDFGDQAQGDARRYFDVIMSNARRMGQLIDDLLAFARMGRKALETSPIDMDQLMKDVIEELRQQNPDRALEFQMAPLPPTQGDPAMFRQVCTNLVSNAVKYTRGREPALIQISAREDDKEMVYIIKDNGVGFEMEFAHKLFGVFQRLHSNKEFEGTGVGLALVHRIVQRHGGRVWADSKVGSGATFSFALPKRRSSA